MLLDEISLLLFLFFYIDCYLLFFRAFKSSTGKEFNDDKRVDACVMSFVEDVVGEDSGKALIKEYENIIIIKNKSHYIPVYLFKNIYIYFYIFLLTSRRYENSIIHFDQ